MSIQIPKLNVPVKGLTKTKVFSTGTEKNSTQVYVNITSSITDTVPVNIYILDNGELTTLDYNNCIYRNLNYLSGMSEVSTGALSIGPGQSILVEPLIKGEFLVKLSAVESTSLKVGYSGLLESVALETSEVTPLYSGGTPNLFYAQGTIIAHNVTGPDLGVLEIHIKEPGISESHLFVSYNFPKGESVYIPNFKVSPGGSVSIKAHKGCFIGYHGNEILL